MGLRIPEPPRNSLAALQLSLAALSERGQFSARGLRKARADQITATLPHEIFTLSLRDAALGRIADAATPTGWRYLLEVDNEVVASAETRLVELGEHVFSLINDGPFIRGTLHALAVAEALGEQRDAVDFELRLLNLPALYLMALWLETEDGRENRAFIPIAPTPPEVEANRAYSDEEFTTRIRDFATTVPSLQPDDTSGGG